MKFKKMISLIMTVAMLVSLSACAQSSGTADTQETSQNAEATGQQEASQNAEAVDQQEASPAEEDEPVTFTFAISAEPSYLDPSIAYNSETAIIMDQIYWPLFSYNENGQVVNEACESYEVSDDGLVYTLHLSKDNYWSDGQPCTAGDYAYGMKHNIGYGPDASFAYFLYDHIAGALDAHEAMADADKMDDVAIKVIDDYTLEITLVEPCSFFTGLLGDSMAFPLRSDYVVDRESTWAYNPEVPTNGPFHPVSINETEEVVMEKNEYYAHADEVQIDTLIARVIKDSQAQLAAFESGEIDVARSLPSDAAVAYAGTEELIIINPTVNASFLWVNMSGNTNPALQDVRVRQALSYAIDRNYLITILGGDEVSDSFYPLYGIVPKGMQGVEGDFREEEDTKRHLADYDLEKAKALLEEAGYGVDNPLTIEYLYNQSTTNEDVAVAIQAMWKEAGIETELRVVEQKAYAADRRAGEYQIARGATTADYLDPSYYLIRYTVANQNYPATEDADYEDLLNSKINLLNPTERMEGLHEVEEYLVGDEMYVIPLYGSASILLLNSRWDGLKNNPSANLSFESMHLK